MCAHVHIFFSMCTHICICMYTHTCILFFETFGSNMKTLYVFTPECFRVYFLRTRTVSYKTTVQLISVQFSYLHRPFSASVKGPQMTFTRFMPGTHFAFGGHVSQSSSEENTYPGFVFVWPIHFEDHRPFIFLTIRFRSCIFGRNVKGPGFGLLRAQMRRLCSQ